MKHFLAAMSLICVLAFPVGCKTATSNTPPAALAPGAVNQFDQQSYKALLAAQASINSLKDSVAADPNLAKFKAPLNQAIADYNIADVAWQTYHGAATAANQQAVTTALTKVNADVSGIQKAIQ